MFDKLSMELREQREKAGISLEQLANKTRIDQKFLEAIDQGNFAFLPDLYVKAFVKQYAKTVGLDEDLIIKKYEAVKEGKEYDPNKPVVKNVEKDSPVMSENQPEPIETPPAAPPVYHDVSLEKKPEEKKKPNKQNLNWLIAGSIAVLAVILIYIFFVHKSEKIIVEETPIEEVVGKNNQRFEEKNSEQTTADNNIIKASTDSLHLTFFAKETSWVYVIVDDNIVKEFTLNPNSKFTISALNDFKGTVGNSGGISMQLDDKPVDFSGRSGSVRNFKLDKSGFIYLNAPPKLEKR